MDKYSEIKKLINAQPPIDMNTYLSQDVKDALKKELEIKYIGIFFAFNIFSIFGHNSFFAMNTISGLILSE